MYSPCRNRCECKEAVCGQAASDAFTSRHSGCSLAWIAHACEPKKPDEVAIASLLNRLMVTLMAPYGSEFLIWNALPTKRSSSFLVGVWLPLMRNNQLLMRSELSPMRNRSFLIGVWLPLMRNDQFLIWSELSLMRNRSFLIGV